MAEFLPPGFPVAWGHAQPSPEALLARATASKAAGNAAYAARDYIEALNCYNVAGHTARSVITPLALPFAPPPAQAPPALAKRARALQLDACNNRAACWLALEQGACALAAAESALDLDAGNAKATERRAVALRMMGLPRAAEAARRHLPAPSEAVAAADSVKVAPAQRLARAVPLRSVGAVPPPTWEHRSAVLRGRLYVLGGVRTDLANTIAAIELNQQQLASGARIAVFSASVADIRVATSAGGSVTWREERVTGGSAVAPPAALSSFVLVADEEASALLLFGGESMSVAPIRDPAHSDTWRLRVKPDDKLQWERLSTRGDAPGSRVGAAGALHPRTRTLFVHGGVASGDAGVSADMHALDLATCVWRRIPARSGAPKPPPRTAHTMVALGAGGDTLAVFGGSDTPHGTSSKDARFYADTLIFDVATEKWRLPALRGSAEVALPKLGPLGGRVQHAAWAANLGDDDSADAADMCIFGGYVIGPCYYGDLRGLELSSGRWLLHDWQAGDDDAPSVVPHCRCGHSVAALVASGREVAVWGGAADSTSRHELLLISLRAPPQPLPESDASTEPLPAEVQTLEDTLRELQALEEELMLALSSSRLDDAERLARAWLARSTLHDHDPPAPYDFAQVLALEQAAKTPEEVSCRLQLPRRTAHAHNALGLVCRHTGRYDEARREYLAAIELLESCNHASLSELAQEHLHVCHFNMAQLCRTQAVADKDAFLYHVRRGHEPGLSLADAANWRAMHAQLSDAELLRMHEFAQLDEAALRRLRTADVAAAAERTGSTAPNPPAWVLRTCGRCAATEQRPGTFKLCGGCGKEPYCGRECQLADWKERHKAACSGKRAAGRKDKA